MRFLLTHGLMNAAERLPESEAVRMHGNSLTYRELAWRTNRLANTLRERGVARGDRVGIFMNKRLETLEAVYGILQAGAAYVPLDPFAPVDRIEYVIGNCGIRTIITSDEKLGNLQKMSEDGTALDFVVGLSDDVESPFANVPWGAVQSAPAVPPIEQPIEDDLAYILYTSGSTGQPKGIMHTHRSGLTFAEWAAETYALTHDDRVSNHAPLHFDLSTFDLFASSIAGACVVPIPEPISKFPASLAKLMAQERISIWYSVPYALIQLLMRGGLASADLAALRWILFAGEVFPTKHLRSLMESLPDVRFSNLYGPTETNVCTYYHVSSLPDDVETPVPIGWPCANVDALIVDGDDEPVADGEVGELLIRSPLVMRGYWGRQDLTDNGFYRRSLAPGMEGAYYRTGDLVRLEDDETLTYLGRKDRQIKTRGYRVELDEVEVALLSHAKVREAAVFTVPDGEGSHLIKSAVLADDEVTLERDDLYGHMANRLPSYAVPVEIRVLEEFPRTSTGKIDRRALQSQFT